MYPRMKNTKFIANIQNGKTYKRAIEKRIPTLQAHLVA